MNMMNSDPRQAATTQVPSKNGWQTVREASRYPTHAPAYPNRAIRRLFSRGRIDLMPSDWRVFLTKQTLGLR